MDDPGEQLNKVLGFRKWLIKSKKFFYKEFKETSNGEKLIYDNLLQYLLNLEQQNYQSKNKQSVRATKGKSKGKTLNESHKDLFFDINLSVQEDKIDQIKFWKRARLMLIAKSWFDQVYESDFLGNHDINLLFTNRKNWSFTNEEKHYIFKSMLEKPGFRPAWFCFDTSNSKFIIDLLETLLYKCTDYTIRYNSFDILNNIGHNFNDDILINLISDSENTYRTSIINKLEPPKYHQFLLNLKNDNSKVTFSGSDFYKNIILVNSKLNFTINPDKEFNNLLTIPNEDVETYTHLLKANIKNVKSDTLKQSLNFIDHRFKELVLKELESRSELTLDILKDAFGSDTVSIKRYAISKLLDYGEDIDISVIEEISKKSVFDRSEFLLLKYYSKKNYEQIKDKYFWYDNKHSAIFYEVLAANFYDKFKKQLRKDLNSNFNTLQIESKRKLELKRGAEIAGILITRFKQDTIEYLKSKYIKGALKGILKNGSKLDVKFAKKYLLNTEYGIADDICIKIFSKFGERKDADYLLEKSIEAENAFKKIDLIKSALIISPGIRGIITKLLKSTDQDILSIALDYYDTIKSKSKIKYLKALLLSGNDSIRIKSLAILVTLLSSNQLRRLLDQYSSKKSYYYDVVAWIDKLIYSPSNISQMYLNQLRKSLNTL